MTDSNGDHNKFLEKLSLITACIKKANDLEEELRKGQKPAIKTGESICIGFHIRHVFDTSAPSVGLNDSSGIKATNISKLNKIHGLQTLNHILDTLYYDNKKKNNYSASKKHTKLCIKIDFDKKLNNDNVEIGCHVFDRESKVDNNKDGWLGCHFTVLEGRVFDHDREYIKDFVSGVIDCPWKRPEPDNDSNRYSIFEDYICGTEKLCDDLKIVHSLSAYRVITAALYQLGSYAKKEDETTKEKLFGAQTVTLIIRSESPFSVVVGVTIITEKINPNIIKISKRFLQSKFNSFISIDGFLALFSSSSKIHIPEDDFIKYFWGSDWYRPEYTPHEPKLMATYLSKFISVSKSKIDSNIITKILKYSLTAFIDVQRNFVGSRLEGKPVCFGFILGNPGLLTHTPREQPFPLVYKNHAGIYKFFKQEELPKQVHLASIPTDRAVVFPYCSPPEHSGAKAELAAFVLEFDEAMEEFRAYRCFRLWSDQYIPYLYYTKRFPWAISSYVGPGAEIRIFAGGHLVAYHYERGWLTISLDEAEKSLQAQKIVDTIIIRYLLQVALQMSRFSNPDAKGGMLIYLANNQTGNQSIKNCSLFQSLTDNQPVRSEDTNNLWLTGRNLIRVKKSDNEDDKLKACYELDYAVARTLLQAAQLDGAIVLYHDKLDDDKSNNLFPVKVHLFGQRINATQKDKNPKSGTRHAAAEALMKNDNIPERSIAIAISSDGPISIWAKLIKNKVFGDPIKIGIPLDT